MNLNQSISETAFRKSLTPILPLRKYDIQQSPADYATLQHDLKASKAMLKAIKRHYVLLRNSTTTPNFHNLSRMATQGSESSVRHVETMIVIK